MMFPASMRMARVGRRAGFLFGTFLGGGGLVAAFGISSASLAALAFGTGAGFGSFATSLVLLGVGWNFMYIGGTTLLISTYSPAEKARAQAINDMTIFVVGLVCSFSAGGLLEALGWQTMNLALIPWLALAAASLVWLGVKQRLRMVEEGAT
ncbi:hypothetical protein NCM_03646 [Burkholderia pseudomallei]